MSFVNSGKLKPAIQVITVIVISLRKKQNKGNYMNYSSNLIMNGERKHRYYVLYRIAASLSPLCGRVAAGVPRHLRHPLRRRRLLLSSASGEPLSKRNERGRNNDTEHYWGKKYLENGILVNLKKMIANCTLSQHSQCQYATLSMSLIFVSWDVNVAKLLCSVDYRVLPAFFIWEMFGTR